MKNETMLDMITSISEAVYSLYFYYIEDYTLRDDLIQEGYYKAYELLKMGNYDPDQSLRNYIFTGVRNAMTNYMYHMNKEKHSSYDLYCDNVEADDNCDYSLNIPNSVDSDYSLDMDLVFKMCDKYSFYGDYMGNVLEYFKSVGLEVPTYSTRVSDPNPIVLKAIIVDIIYSI